MFKDIIAAVLAVVVVFAFFYVLGVTVYKDRGSKPAYCEHKDGYVLNTESKEFCNK